MNHPTTPGAVGFKQLSDFKIEKHDSPIPWYQIVQAKNSIASFVYLMHWWRVLLDIAQAFAEALANAECREKLHSLFDTGMFPYLLYFQFILRTWRIRLTNASVVEGCLSRVAWQERRKHSSKEDSFLDMVRAPSPAVFPGCDDWDSNPEHSRGRKSLTTRAMHLSFPICRSQGIMRAQSSSTSRNLEK